MKKLFEIINRLWRGSKWHMTSIFFTYAFTWASNVHNFMYLRQAVFNFNDWVVPQYFLQLLLCGGGSYWVAYAIEIKQIRPGNNTETLWKKYARPDILVTTVFGILGCILGILYYTNYY